ncbi:MAG TPA: hypothetical protein VGA87_08720 [Pyrinomonadaceae bacterium]
MKRWAIPTIACAFMLFGSAASSSAQVRRVEMRLTRYLCNSCATSIGKAVSRLEFAPPLNEIRITDVQRGMGVFVPKPDETAAYAPLRAAVKKAGYTLYSAEITVEGTVVRDAAGWSVTASGSGQRFALEGREVNSLLGVVSSGALVEIKGDWKSGGKGNTAREMITPESVKPLPVTRKPTVLHTPA